MPATPAREAPRLEPGLVVRHRETIRLGLVTNVFPRDKELNAIFEGKGKPERIAMEKIELPADLVQAEKWEKAYFVVDAVNGGTSSGPGRAHDPSPTKDSPVNAQPGSALPSSRR